MGFVYLAALFHDRVIALEERVSSSSQVQITPDLLLVWPWSHLAFIRIPEVLSGC